MTPPPHGDAPLRVAVIIGSARDDRVASHVTAWFVDLARHRPDIDPDVIDVLDHPLPLAGTRPGGSRTSVSQRLEVADAFVIVTPEYNHSYPAALKNLIDWHFTEWQFKPVAFVSYGAASAGIRAVEHLRTVFSELQSSTIRSAVALHAPWQVLDGPSIVPGEAADKAAELLLDELTWWAGCLRYARSQGRPGMPTPLDADPSGQRTARAVAQDFVRGLQQGLDARDADVYNEHFSDDVLWGSPYGATVRGLDGLHAVHVRLLAADTAPRGSKYQLVEAARPAADVVVAHVRRQAPVLPGADAFSEMALYVLVRDGKQWRLAAGQNTPIVPPEGALAVT